MKIPCHLIRLLVDVPECRKRCRSAHAKVSFEDGAMRSTNTKFSCVQRTMLCCSFFIVPCLKFFAFDLQDHRGRGGPLACICCGRHTNKNLSIGGWGVHFTYYIYIYHYPIYSHNENNSGIRYYFLRKGGGLETSPQYGGSVNILHIVHTLFINCSYLFINCSYCTYLPVQMEINGGITAEWCILYEIISFIVVLSDKKYTQMAL